MGRHSKLRSKRHLIKKSLVGMMVFAPITGINSAHAAPPEAWDRLAECESTGQWDINTGNGYFGGLQFTISTWRAFGGTGMPHQASREEQIRVAERTLAGQGWDAWPVCSRKAGVREYGPDLGRPVAAVVEGTREHIVVAGDTLSEIAPDNWEIIAFQNNIADPDLIFVGQVIRL